MDLMFRMPIPRDRWLRGGLWLLFFLFWGRLFQMQIVEGPLYRRRSEQNHVRQIRIPAPRGLILDRKGRILVDNRPGYSLFCVPFEFRKNRADAAVMSSIIGLPVETMEEKIDANRGGPFTPIRLFRDMDFSTLSRIEENRLEVPGVFYQIEPVRAYPAGVSMAHVLGFIGELGEEEWKDRKERELVRGDVVGKSGIEKSYDAVLRGTSGVRYVEVDVRGREIGTFGGLRDLPPSAGMNLVTGLDLDLQRLADSLMTGRRGAVLALDPKTGEILIMVSKPDYPLSVFDQGMTAAEWKAMIADPDVPLLNRTVQANLPPGSTYKPVLAAAALAEGVRNPSQKTECTGVFVLGNRAFDCWKPEGHGMVDMRDALAVSCNVFFYRLGLEVGVDCWARYGRLFGFGSPVALDLEEKSPGLLPNRRFLDRRYGKNGWSQGMMANLSVGQGDLLVTPIQMARLAAWIATKGNLPQMHIVRSVEDPVTKFLKTTPIRTETSTAIPAEVLEFLKDAMDQAINRPDGTGLAARLDKTTVCGKTGTAQNPRGEPHAWFIGFAPRNDPGIALVVVLENAGTGGGQAAPIAGEIFRRFFSLEASS